MTELEKRIQKLSWRMRLVRMVYATTRALFYVLCIAALLIFIERLLFLTFDVMTATALLLAITIPIGLFYAMLLRRATFKAALGADENLGLEARMSSALLLKDQTRDPLVGELLADATSQARKVNPGRAFPFQFSRETRFVFVPLLAFVGFYFIPDLDLLGRKAEIKAVLEEKAEVKKAAEHLAPAVKKLQEQAEKNKLEETKDVAQKMEELKVRLQKGDIDRKEGLAKLSTLQDQVEQVKKRYESEAKGQRGIRQTSEMQFTKKLADALRKGDFKQAADEMNKLQEDVKSGALNERDLAALKREMEQISRDTSDQNSKLSQAFAEASKSLEKKNQGEKPNPGANSEQNNNPADSGQNQNQQEGQKQNQGDGMQNAQKQIEQLARMAEDAKQLGEASKDCKTCKNGLSKSGSGKTGQLGKSGTSTQAKDGQGQMAKQGTDGKAGKEGESASLTSKGQGKCEKCGQSGCKGDCQGSGQTTGQWQVGVTQSKGTGMGGPGQGRGGNPEDPGEVDVDFIESRPEGLFDKRADLDASWEVDGEPLESQANMQVVESHATGDQAKDDALDREEVPIGYEELVRDYFSDLDQDSAK